MAGQKKYKFGGRDSGNKEEAQRGSSSMAESIGALVASRNTQYGAAWLTTGKLIGFLSKEFYEFLERAPNFSYAWVIILNKLVRLLHDPENLDSWQDIAGYATLVAEELEHGKASSTQS